MKFDIGYSFGKKIILIFKLSNIKTYLLAKNISTFSHILIIDFGIWFLYFMLVCSRFYHLEFFAPLQMHLLFTSFVILKGNAPITRKTHAPDTVCFVFLLCASPYGQVCASALNVRIHNKRNF